MKTKPFGLVYNDFEKKMDVKGVKTQRDPRSREISSAI